MEFRAGDRIEYLGRPPGWAADIDDPVPGARGWIVTDDPVGGVVANIEGPGTAVYDRASLRLSTPRLNVHGVRADEWEVFRDIRLRALADTPEAFGSTLEREQAYPPERWREMAVRGQSGHYHLEGDPPPTNLILIADDGERAVGMAGAFLEDDGAAHIWGMWVDPARRGEGIARHFLRWLVAWSMTWVQARIVRLDVTETNEAAARLYESAGFRPTGRRVPLREGSTLHVIEMERSPSLEIGIP